MMDWKVLFVDQSKLGLFISGFKKMIMDIKAKESKNNPKVAEMKKDAVKQDNSNIPTVNTLPYHFC